MTTGSVALVGAGPGDQSLITIRGHALLRAADVVVYDPFVARELLASARRDAELIDAGESHTDLKARRAVTAVIVRAARAGRSVVRLMGGDPFIFGGGGGEALALAKAGIPCEIVPGVTSALAAPASAGIPVTLRDVASSVAIATGHEEAKVDWAAAAGADTTVVLMPMRRLDEIVGRLIDEGKDPTTPAAMIENATRPSMRTVSAPLERIADAAASAGVRSPAILVVGDVVNVREKIGGWDTRPLSGRRVLVTRTREQAGELSSILRELGADAVEAPAIRIEPPRAMAPLDRALARLRDGAFAWLVLTSANGVRMLADRLRAASLDARALASVRVAAVGPGTAEALAKLGIVADLVPASFTTAAVGRAFPSGEGRVLLWRADIVEPGLEDALTKKGWGIERVVAYRLVSEKRMDPPVRTAVMNGGFDVLTFASAGTVRAFMKLMRAVPPASVKVVCIGPVTAKAARENGLRVARVADPHTIPGLAAAVLDVMTPRKRSRTPSRTREKG